MVEKLSITIALEGGKEIQRQLEGIGKTGQQAFLDISKAAQQVGGFKNLKPDDVTAALKNMGKVGEEELNKIGAAVNSAIRMEKLVGVVKGLETGFANFGRAALGIGAAVGVVAGFVKSVTAAAGAISKVDAEAIKLGVTIQKFQQLKSGLEAVGLSEKQVESGMAAIGKAAEQAKIIEVTKELERLRQEAGAGIGGVGLSQFQKLIEASKGVGAEAKLAKEGLKEFGFTFSETANKLGTIVQFGNLTTILSEITTKSLPEMIAKTGDITKGVAAFVEQLRTMPDGLARSQQAMAALSSEAGVALVQGLRAGIITFDQFKQGIGGITEEMAKTAVAVEQSSNRLSTSWGKLKETLSGKLVTTFGPALIAAFDGITAALNASAAEWGQAIVGFVSKLLELRTAIGNAVVSTVWDTFATAASTAIQKIIGWVDVLIEKMARVGSSILKTGTLGGGGESEIPGKARGGLLGGRGSGTSDSNLAWVSRGEHIMPASAVRQPGVLALLEALRRSGGNLRGVLDGMGRFAAGGVVPRFAAGGLVGGMGHLGTVDLRTDHGSVTLMASGSAMDQLSRLAVTKRMTSTGKKPGFIG